MKKTVSFICCILILLIFASCTSFNQTKVSYTIYYGSSDASVVLGESSFGDVSFKNAGEKTFSFSSKTEISKPTNIEEKKTFEITGQTYSFEYRRTYQTELAGASNFDIYSKFVTYRNDNAYMDVRLETGELLLFGSLKESDYNASGDLTEGDARAVADSTLLALYGKDAQQEYDYDTTVFTDTDTYGTFYTIVYRKFVWGLQSKDAIQISVNMQGNVISINAKELGVFSSAESKITKSDIENAISVLDETFSENWSIGDKTLIVDAEGDYYISAQLYRENGNFPEVETVYINVK